MVVAPAPGVVVPVETQLSIISAAGGLSGTFNPIGGPSGQTYSASYSSTAATLTLTSSNTSGIPRLSIAGITVLQPSTGTTTAHLTIGLSWATTQNVTVQYQTVDGTATAGVDYTAVPLQTATIPAGQTSVTIPSNILAAASPEPIQIFTVALSNPTNTTISTANATVTLDTEPAYVLVCAASVKQFESILPQIFHASSESETSLEIERDDVDRRCCVSSVHCP